MYLKNHPFLGLLINLFLFSKMGLCENEKDLIRYKFSNQKKSSSLKLDSHDCFPSLLSDLQFPNLINTNNKTSSSSLSPESGWWCERKDEYAWLGFSYDVGDCPSENEMSLRFKWMKKMKGARYVRIYNTCDQILFNQNLINSAVNAQIGIYGLIWFGFQGDSLWKIRKENLLKEIRKNKWAPYVIRVITLGSEPLFDEVLNVKELTDELKKLSNELKPYGIPVTISEMTYGFQKNHDSPSLFEVMDLISLNVLPVFDTDASTSNLAWRFVKFCISYGKLHGNGKPVVITQTGWPSNKDQAGDSKAMTDIRQEKDYFDLLNDHCDDFKEQGVGWFAHIFAEESLSGWGIVLENNSEKFSFNPLTNC
ncbi:glycoside hydrolase superfamily [Melampsora americana]|nr:glycoside hydrolase superfamily [Melampsora americana]